jgi:argininosuccinate lyase
MSTPATPPSGAWSGRFSEPVSEIVKRYTASIPFDYRLAEFDIQGSLAHAAMLHHVGVLTRDDLDAIRHGMAELLEEIRAGRFAWSLDREDVHLNIEAALTAKIGDAGKRLHTGRSRNDQVAADIRLYLRDAIDRITAGIRACQTSLVDLAEAHADTVMPGFTHLQVAQPVTFGHHLLAYVEMLARARGRLSAARERLTECPLGAAALAGTSFPIDRFRTAAALGFARPTANSLDSVSDRDFVLETLSAASICAIHLSRLAEEIVLWATSQFGFVRLSDAFSTGSSIMPQK